MHFIWRSQGHTKVTPTGGEKRAVACSVDGEEKWSTLCVFGLQTVHLKNWLMHFRELETFPTDLVPKIVV